HAKEWETEAFIGEESVGRGRGVSKRAAAQSAARDALQKLGVGTT
ncbi:MAG: putative dsRNA-binding protein, partial [Phototrophicaceae bacterium]